MNADFTSEELAFQKEVRTFLESEFPLEFRTKIDANRRLSKEEIICWQKILYKK